MPTQSRWEQAARREGGGAAQGVTAFKELLVALVALEQLFQQFPSKCFHDLHPVQELPISLPILATHAEHHQVKYCPTPVDEIQNQFLLFIFMLLLYQLFEIVHRYRFGESKVIFSSPRKTRIDLGGWKEKGAENQCCLCFSLNILFLLCCPSAASQHWNYVPALSHSRKLN